MPTEQLRVASSLTLFDPDDAPIPVRNVQAEITYDGDQVKRFQISFAVDVDMWPEIDDGGWFNMPVEDRGPTFGGGFEPAPEIEIDAVLDDGMLEYINAHSQDAFEAAALLHKATRDPDHPLAHSESWYGLHVKQQRAPSLKAGFATRRSGLLK